MNKFTITYLLLFSYYNNVPRLQVRKGVEMVEQAQMEQTQVIKLSSLYVNYQMLIINLLCAVIFNCYIQFISHRIYINLLVIYFNSEQIFTVLRVFV